MKTLLRVLRRRVVIWARALRAALAEPGALETDGLRHDEAVFQRAPVRRTR